VSVLSDRSIEGRFDEIFESGTADPENIRAAKYYLTLGDRFLILPGGERFGEEGAPCRKGIVLMPGQTALVSSREKISIPVDLSAIFGPIFDVSDSGILFFGGMLIDPGFGGRIEGEGWVRDPEPLSFYLANVGSKPYSLHPGRDRIASIAFQEVKRPHKAHKFPERLRADTARNVRAELFDPKIDRPTDQALGLVEDIREMRQRVDKFEASTKQVVTFGVIVLAVTLFAALVSLLASSGAENVVLSLSLEEVVVGFVAVAAGPLCLAAAFYISVAAAIKLRELLPKRSARRRKARQSASS
jgi:deoxycytidine triphosphate deaminase